MKCRYSLLILSLLAAACSPAAAIVKPPEYAPADQAKCGVKKSAAKPLIVEWPSADQVALESQSKRGLIAVHYLGCEMEILRQCHAKGTYRYVPTTRRDDSVTMRTADELYAAIPVHAAKFEAQLQKSGTLSVNMSMVGSYEAEASGLKRKDLEGDCAKATHVITALTAGAFEFVAGGEASIGAGAKGLGAEAGASSQAARETLNKAGDKSACSKATTKDQEPPEGCGALLRVEVIPLGDAQVPEGPRVVAPPPKPSIAPWVVGGAGVAVLGVGAVFGGLTFSTYASAKSACPTMMNCTAGALSTRSQAITFADVADVAIPVGGVAVGAAAILLLTGRSRDASPAAALAPIVGPGNVGLSLGGAF
jgi:hypothetical protein